MEYRVETVQTPSALAVNTSDLAAHMRVGDEVEESQLLAFSLAAESAVEDYIRGPVQQKTFDLHLRRFPRRQYFFDSVNQVYRDFQNTLYSNGVELETDFALIESPIEPVQSITLITYYDESGALMTLDPAEYRLLGNRIEPVNSWPVVERRAEAVTIRMIAGYDCVPEPIKAAIKLMAAHLSEHREAVLPGQAVTETPLGFKALLQPYMRHEF